MVKSYRTLVLLQNAFHIGQSVTRNRILLLSSGTVETLYNVDLRCDEVARFKWLPPNHTGTPEAAWTRLVPKLFIDNFTEAVMDRFPDHQRSVPCEELSPVISVPPTSSVARLDSARQGVQNKGMKVVHCKKAAFDIYIGRPSVWGNPFSHLASSHASVRVASRIQAIQAFDSWLAGTEHKEVEPERRQQILSRLFELKGKTLGCWCAPLACHGTVLARLANQ